MADEAVNGDRTNKQFLADIERKVDRVAEASATAASAAAVAAAQAVSAHAKATDANASVQRLTRVLLGDKELDPEDTGAIGEIRLSLKAAESTRLKRRELVAAWGAGVLSFLVGVGLIITSLLR